MAGVYIHNDVQWRNFGLKSEGNQAKFLTWCTYKVGVRPPTLKSGGPSSVPPKITPMLTSHGRSNLWSRYDLQVVGRDVVLCEANSKLTDKDLSRYLNKTESVCLRKA